MTEITAAVVEHAARLARLRLSAEERETFARQLAAIVRYAEQVQAAAVAELPPLRLQEPGPLRDDRPGAPLEREQALAQAPDAADGLFRVPRVLGG